MIQNTLLMTQNTLFVKQMTQNTLFLRQSCNDFITAFIATVESHNIRAWRT